MLCMPITVNHLFSSLNRDAKWLAWFEQQFAAVAGSNRQIDVKEFKQALRLKEVGITICSLDLCCLFFCSLM